MSAWVIRGLGMAVLHGAAITLLAKYAVYHPTDQTLVVSLALAVLVGAAALWSALDAWRGLPDRGKVWFISALIAGPVAGILYVIGRAVFVDQTGVSELGGALTGGAAFSALLVLIPAGLGLFVGGRIGGRGQSDRDESDGDESGRGESGRGRSGRGESGRVDAGRGESSRGGSGRVEPSRGESSRVESGRARSERPRPGPAQPGAAKSGRVRSGRVQPPSEEPRG